MAAGTKIGNSWEGEMVRGMMHNKAVFAVLIRLKLTNSPKGLISTLNFLSEKTRFPVFNFINILRAAFWQQPFAKKYKHKLYKQSTLY